MFSMLIFTSLKFFSFVYTFFSLSLFIFQMTIQWNDTNCQMWNALSVYVCAILSNLGTAVRFDCVWTLRSALSNITIYIAMYEFENKIQLHAVYVWFGALSIYGKCSSFIPSHT